MFQYDEWFNQFFFSERFIKLAELLMGTSIVGKNLQWFNKPPGAGQPTPPHQDGYYFMLEPNEAVTMWLALDEVTEENGCVRYCRGSHQRGLRRGSRVASGAQAAGNQFMCAVWVVETKRYIMRSSA